jgi:DtxR family Mn-dependent transcriptional regulator
MKMLGSKNPLEEAELIEHSLSPSTTDEIDNLLEFFSQNPKIYEKYDKFKALRAEK